MIAAPNFVQSVLLKLFLVTLRRYNGFNCFMFVHVKAFNNASIGNSLVLAYYVTTAVSYDRVLSEYLRTRVIAWQKIFGIECMTTSRIKNAWFS